MLAGHSLGGLISEVEAYSFAGIAPVLLILGSRDALFPPPGGQFRAPRYTSSGEVTYVEVAGAPHAIMLSRQAPQFRAAVAKWLSDHGA